MKKTRLLLFSIIGVLILFSCIKSSDFEFNKMTSPVYNGEWAIPLVTSHITLKDILKGQSTALQTDAQGLVSFIYSIKNLTSTSADQLMKIPDQNLPVQNITFPNTDPVTHLQLNLTNGTQFPLSFKSDIPITLANATQKLDSIYVKTGSIRIPINTNFNKAATFTINAPNIIKKLTRNKLSIPLINITPSSPNAVVTIDISNCIIILKTIAGVANTIHFDIDMNMQGNTNPTLATYNFNMGVGITNLLFGGLYGNLGQFNTSLSQTLDISLFKSNLGGGFQFGNGAVSINFNIDNSFGLPIQLNANTFTAHSDINTPHDVPIKLFGAALPNNIDILAPTVFGQTKTTSVVSTNANIADAFNISPNKIVLVANALTNPGTPSNLNFVSDQSKINMNMDIMLKFFASINNFTFQDTLSFDLQDITKLENIAFRLNTTNGFPLGVNVQVYFTDINYTVLDAMFAEPSPLVLKPATVSGAPDYKTIAPTNYQFPDIVYDQTRLMKIKNTKKIIIKAVLNTDPLTNSGLIKIYDSYFLDTKIAIRTKAKISSK